MRILIIDDSELSRFNIKQGLDKKYKVTEAESFEEGLNYLESDIFDLCFIDLNLGGGNDLQGLDLIEVAVRNNAYPVVMSSYESDEVIKRAYELGCKDYYAKGNEEANVNETIRRYYEGKEEFTKELIFKIYPTRNVRQKKIIEDAIPVIGTDIALLISGPTGTGKTALAKGIHDISRGDGPFIKLNCGGLSESLLASELFGYGKGAFTGASEAKSGKLLLANGGTLFLDEVDSMPLSMQTSLLTAIETGVFYPVNSDKAVKSKFRLICAGISDPMELVRKGIFRLDFFQRISGYTINLLPLKERPEDIGPIVREVTSSSRRIVFSKEAKDFIERDYVWPGNIRQLIQFSEVLSKISSGVVSKNQVKACISETALNLPKSSLISTEHLDLARKVGLQEFLNIMRDELIKEGLRENGGKGRKLAAEFKMSTATLYRFTKNNPISKEAIYEIQ